MYYINDSCLREGGVEWGGGVFFAAQNLGGPCAPCARIPNPSLIYAVEELSKVVLYHY